LDRASAAGNSAAGSVRVIAAALAAVFALLQRRDQQNSQREKENRAAIDAAENEGLPVVGVGDETPSRPPRVAEKRARPMQPRVLTNRLLSMWLE
jgi:hypothetical protein